MERQMLGQSGPELVAYGMSEAKSCIQLGTLGNGMFDQLS